GVDDVVHEHEALVQDPLGGLVARQLRAGRRVEPHHPSALVGHDQVAAAVTASRAYWKDPSNRQRMLPSPGSRHWVSAIPETRTPPSGSTVIASFQGP